MTHYYGYGIFSYYRYVTGESSTWIDKCIIHLEFRGHRYPTVLSRGLNMSFNKHRCPLIFHGVISQAIRSSRLNGPSTCWPSRRSRMYATRSGFAVRESTTKLSHFVVVGSHVAAVCCVAVSIWLRTMNSSSSFAPPSLLRLAVTAANRGNEDGGGNEAALERKLAKATHT